MFHLEPSTPPGMLAELVAVVLQLELVLSLKEQAALLPTQVELRSHSQQLSRRAFCSLSALTSLAGSSLR